MTTQEAKEGLFDDIALGTATRAVVDDELRKYYYGDVALTGAFHPTLDDYDRLQPTPYGLAPLWQAWYGALRGESGNYYMPVRFNHVMMTPRLHLPRTPMGGPSEDVPEARNSFYGYTSNDVVDGKWVVAGRGKPDRAFVFTVEPGKGAVWDEPSILHLEFEWIGPAWQIYQPDFKHSFYYLAHVNRITGQILGDPVVGVGGFELAWSHGALEWREVAIPTRVEDFWMIWHNRFADGGFEAGALCASSRPGLGVGIVITENGAQLLRDIDPEVEADDQGRVRSCRWHSGGRTWEYVSENPASLTSPRNPSYHWYFGTCRELGVEREIAESLVYAEILPRALESGGR